MQIDNMKRRLLAIAVEEDARSSEVGAQPPPLVDHGWVRRLRARSSNVDNAHIEKRDGPKPSEDAKMSQEPEPDDVHESEPDSVKMSPERKLKEDAIRIVLSRSVGCHACSS